MPVFFWTIGLWKTPLSACLRLFRDAENEVLPETTASTDDLLSLDDSFSPWKATATAAADVARAKAPESANPAYLSPHVVSAEEKEAGQQREEQRDPNVVLDSTRTSSSPCSRRRVCLSPVQLQTVIAFHPAKSPLPLTYAAAHPLFRLVAEQARGLCFPHGTTRLTQREQSDVDTLTTSLGVAETAHRPRLVSTASYPVRHVQASSLVGLGQYVSVAEWWWSRPLGAATKVAVSASECTPITASLALTARRRRQKPERGAPLPEINRNWAVPPVASQHTSLKSAQNTALKTTGDAELHRFEDAFSNWRSPTTHDRSDRPARDACTLTIEQLAMEGFNIADTLSLTRVTAFLHVRVLSLKGCQYVTSVAVLGRLPQLQELDLSLSGVTRLDGLERSASLRSIKVVSCLQLQSLSPLGAVASLRSIVASQSAIYDVSGLAQSRSLVSVKLYGCLELTDVSALGSIPTLQELAASESNVVTMDGIAQSPSLVLIGLRYCDIHDVNALAPLTTLEVLNASCTPIRSVEPLRTCTRLRELAVSGCAQLRSLSALGVLPALEVIDASNSAVEGVAGLHQAPRLAKLNLTNCWRLGAAGALGQCPRLTVLHMSSSGVDSIGGLEASRSLKILDVSFCKRLTDADVRSVLALRPLEVLNVTGCTALKHYMGQHIESTAELQARHQTFLHD